MDKNNTKKEAAPGSGYVMPINLFVSTDDLKCWDKVRMSCSCETITRVVSRWGETLAPQHLFLPGNFTASVLKVAVTSEPQASSLHNLLLSSKDCGS